MYNNFLYITPVTELYIDRGRPPLSRILNILKYILNFGGKKKEKKKKKKKEIYLTKKMSFGSKNKMVI